MPTTLRAADTARHPPNLQDQHQTLMSPSTHPSPTHNRRSRPLRVHEKRDHGRCDERCRGRRRPGRHARWPPLRIRSIPPHAGGADMRGLILRNPPRYRVTPPKAPGRAGSNPCVQQRQPTPVAGCGDPEDQLSRFEKLSSNNTGRLMNERAVHPEQEKIDFFHKLRSWEHMASAVERGCGLPERFGCSNHIRPSKLQGPSDWRSIVHASVLPCDSLRVHDTELHDDRRVVTLGGSGHRLAGDMPCG